ncbi:MAG: MATE family efflux transporter [Oscillospiraceae bacterium]|jgi:putative MATE family efflux protein|nr:MATE family efflux transporter [Oscillospiraceae bacterium]
MEEISNQARGTTDMTVGSPRRHILVFALPILAGNVFQQLYSMVDAIVVGKAVGGMALAGVGTTVPIVTLITSLFAGMGLGASVLLSQFYGAGDLGKVRRLVSSVYSLLLPIIAVLTAVSLPLAGALLRLLHVPAGDTFTMARLYMMIVIPGFLGSFGFYLNAGILQSMGNSTVPFLFLCLACGMNIVLDLIFVFLFHWGVVGAAVATVISETFSWVAGIVYINRRYSFLHLTLLKFDVDKKLLAHVARVGLPTGISQSLFSLGNVFMQRLINEYGTLFMAGFTGANHLNTFATMPIQSIDTSVTTFTGQNIGQGRLDRVRRGLRAGLLMAGGYGAVIGVLALPFGGDLMSLFVNEESVIRMGVVFLRTVLPFFVLQAVLYVLNAVLRGSGRAVVPMVSMLVSMLLVRVLSAYSLAAFFGPDAMFYSYGLGWAAGIVISAGSYLYVRRRIPSDPQKRPEM